MGLHCPLLSESRTCPVSVGSVYQEGLLLHLLSLHLADSPIQSAIQPAHLGSSLTHQHRLPPPHTHTARRLPQLHRQCIHGLAVLCVVTQAEGDNLRLMVFTLLPRSGWIGGCPSWGLHLM